MLKAGDLNLLTQAKTRSPTVQRRWSWPAMALAVLWLAVAATAAFALFWMSFFSSGGDPNTAAGRAAVRSSLMPQLLSGLAATAGPLGIWLVRRSRPWLWLTIAVLAVALLNGLIIYTRSI